MCSSGDGGITSSIPSQASLASSSSLDFFDPLPTSTSAVIFNPTRKTPESFLGPNAALVNLDSLVTKPAQPAPVVNPFLASTGEGWGFVWTNAYRREWTQTHSSVLFNQNVTNYMFHCLHFSRLVCLGASAPAAHANPFQVTQPAPPTLNQMRVSPMPAGFGGMVESMPLASLPTQPTTMVPLAGMTPMGRAVAGVGTNVGMSAGIPASMSMPQPLMSMPPQAGTQPAGTTNPFLLWGGAGGEPWPRVIPLLFLSLLLWLLQNELADVFSSFSFCNRVLPNHSPSTASLL